MKKTFHVEKSYDNCRIDRWVRNNFKKIPQSLLEKNLRKGKIKVNHKKVKSSFKVKYKDLIEIFHLNIKDSIKNKVKFLPSSDVIKSNEKQIIDNNENFIVVNKEAGISVQGGTKSKKNLIDILAKSEIFQNSKPYTVHRLDKDTSGIFLIAKNRPYAQLLTTLFRLRKVHKTYLAICHGEIEKNFGEWNDDLIRYDNKKKIIEKAKTIYKEKTGKISGWQPDENFLKSLNPPQDNKETLLLLDKALRKYLSAIYTPRQFENNEESQIQSFEENIEDDSKINLISKIELTLRNCGEPIIKELINQDKKKWDKDKSRKLAWELYIQGLSQREIAKKCAHKQSWVSKLLPEKKISESIAQESALILLRINEFSSLRNDINGIERLVESLKNHLINSELDEKRPLLKQLIKEAIE